MISTPQQVPDTAQQSPVVDSMDTSLTRIGEGVTETGRLILSGDWEAVWQLGLETATGLAVGFVPNLLSALFVGAFFYGLYRVLQGIIRGLIRRSDKVDKGIELILLKTFRLIAWSFIGLIVLDQVGVNITALVAGLGIAGIAVGFAAQDSLQNFISGVTIFLDRPFRIDDWVTVGGYYGKVTNITLRSTRLRTPNLETVIFPSVDMVTQPLTNHSAGGPLRVDVPFGIAYKEDIDEARRTVLATIDHDDARLAPMDHAVVTTLLNDSSVDLQLRVFIKNAGDARPVSTEYTEKVRKALAAADIEIPFPHLQLFIDEAKGLRGTSVRVDGPSEG